MPYQYIIRPMGQRLLSYFSLFFPFVILLFCPGEFLENMLAGVDVSVLCSFSPFLFFPFRPLAMTSTMIFFPAVYV